MHLFFNMLLVSSIGDNIVKIAVCCCMADQMDQQDWRTIYFGKHNNDNPRI